MIKEIKTTKAKKASAKAAELLLIEDMASFSKDPLSWVMYSFEWGKGDLAGFDGPEQWQRELLDSLGKGLKTTKSAIQEAIASGHGIGKSAMVSWLVLWSLSTHEDAKGILTANTETQLRTKTWPELSKWYSRFVAKHWFKLTATAIYSVSPEHEKTWRFDAIPWSENNTEAFAGLHNQGKRITLIFDEASSIADKIWEVSEGALTDKDTEILWFAFGNPTRNTGRFRECFSKYRHRWNTKQIDSRTVKITNKEQINNWVNDYGEDSDFVRVRVRGIFPNTSDRQFISSQLIESARGKHIPEHKYSFAPVIIGVDPAIYGDDECVIYKRQGLASTQLMSLTKIGDDLTIAGYIAKLEDEHKADAVFVDMGYGTGIVSAGRAMGRNWILVPFASASSDPGYLNKRAEIWGLIRDWLKEGGALPDDPRICEELSSPEYIVKLTGKIQLESKEDMRRRGLSSPNRADALALTFSFPVQSKSVDIRLGQPKNQEFCNQEYDLF